MVLCVEFGSLTQAQLLEKVRALQNLAYRLGVEEGRTMEYKMFSLSAVCCSKGNE
jgi:hypothetical protein